MIKDAGSESDLRSCFCVGLLGDIWLDCVVLLIVAGAGIGAGGGGIGFCFTRTTSFLFESGSI